MSKMAVVFDSYHHTAEILFVGEEDKCLAETKEWWDDMIGAETAWEKLDWQRDTKGRLIQSTYAPMVVICESTVACEHFSENGAYIAVLFTD